MGIIWCLQYSEAFSNFEIDVINSRTVFGAAPEVEGVLLEESIKDLEGIKQLNSTAVEGMGTVSIQVEEDYDVQSLLDEVKVQVDAIPSFPQTLKALFTVKKYNKT